MKQQRHRVTWGKLGRILRYLLPYWWLEVEVVICMGIVVFLSLIDPLVFKLIIDDVIPDRNIGMLHILMIALVVVYLSRALFTVLTAYIFNFAGQRILFDIRSQLFQHLERLHMGFYQRTKTGEVLSRLNSDVESLQSLMASTFVDLITDSITILAILAFLVYFDWKLTLVSLTVFPLLAITMAYLSRKIRARSKEVREQVADILHFFQEAISGMKLVQSFVREKYEARRFLRKGKRMINLRIGLGLFGSMSTASAVFFGALGPALVLYYGAYRVITGALTVGAVFAFYLYVVKLLAPVFRLAQLNVVIQTALASIDRIFEFLDIEPEIRDVPNAVVPIAVEGHVSFEHIGFYYRPEERVLEDVSFDVKPGERLAIVGPTGVGKTTIIDLICRFYDPVRGAVKLDGTDIRKIKLTRLRQLIGIVSQDTFLFNASIKENLRYGKLKATDDEIYEAAEKASIHDFISSLNNGYETLVGDRGFRLSGGERQRLAIARAILKDPKILILDEATSALDSQSEALIQKALEPLMRQRTTITIAHRLSTVVDSDAILVLSNGRIVERGTHDVLLTQDGLYKALWDEQVKRQGQQQL